jgi:hypothetical protein
VARWWSTLSPTPRRKTAAGSFAALLEPPPRRGPTAHRRLQAGLPRIPGCGPMSGAAATQNWSENGAELEPRKPRRRRAGFLDRVLSATPCSFLLSGTIMLLSWASRGQREAVCLWRRGRPSWRTGCHVVRWLTASGGIRDRICCTAVRPISSRTGADSSHNVPGGKGRSGW